MNLEELRVGDSSWYEFPDGTKVNGEDKAQDYADSLDELEAAVEEERAADEEELPKVTAHKEHKAEGVITTESFKTDEPEVEEAEEVILEDNDQPVLVEMTRQNRLFEFVGKNRVYGFKHNAKIMLVDREDIDPLMDQGGFRIVTPEKARQYYS